MKNYYSITAFLLFAALSFKQMNMAKVTSNLYMDKYEVTNGEWKTFEKYLLDKGENPKEYRSNDIWENMRGFGEQYYSKVEHNKYPVAGVTYEGAQKYCTWKGKQSKIKGIFRLPTIEEIEYQIAEGEQGRKWRKWKKIAKKEGMDMYNFSSPEKPVGIGCIAPSNSYADNKFDIHNIKGNMAEMTTIKGKSVGGSYIDLDNKDWATHIQTYDAPANWLGFRCVCEL